MTTPRKTSDRSAAPPAQAAPNENEQRAIAAARSRLANRAPRVTTRLETDTNGSIANIGPEHSDREGWLTRLEVAFGTNGRNFAITQLNHLLACAHTSDGYDTSKVNGLLAAVEGARPADEVQAMLAVQMALTHEMTMQAIRRAMRVDQIPQYDSAGGMAVRLMRTYTAQVEALARLQRGGEQVVKVVHVHSGAQAVVGNVVTASGASDSGLTGGGHDEIGNQPHAKGKLSAPAAAPLSPLRSADAQREFVQIAQRPRQGTLPDARGGAGQRGA